MIADALLLAHARLAPDYVPERRVVDQIPVLNMRIRASNHYPTGKWRTGLFQNALAGFSRSLAIAVDRYYQKIPPPIAVASAFQQPLVESELIHHTGTTAGRRIHMYARFRSFLMGQPSNKRQQQSLVGLILRKDTNGDRKRHQTYPRRSRL